jgi:type II secretory pathway pseudopilin PulG
MGCDRSAGQKGFTYVWVLFVVALTSIALAGAVQVWRTEVRREKEKQLMFAGEQFRQAIGSYYENSPGLPKRYPDSLEKLLLDKRFPTVKRHLRKIFFDPMTSSSEWGLARQPNAGIIGVYSLSKEIPLKRANFPERYADFAEAKDYRDWKFIYLPGDPAVNPPQTQAAPADPFATPQSEWQAGDLRPQPGTPGFQPGPETFDSQPRPESERGAPSLPSPFSLSPSPSDQEDPRSSQPDSSPQNIQY